MDKKCLKEVKELLVKEVYKQAECLEAVNTEEMGEVIDMIKDI